MRRQSIATRAAFVTLLVLAAVLAGSSAGVAQVTGGAGVSVASASTPKVTDYWGAINGSISAVAIIVAGALGLRRYRKERPYFARVNLSLVADLFADDENEFVRANVGAQSIGKKRLELVASAPAQGELGCFVAIYPYQGGAPARTWTNPITVVSVFEAQAIESGETIEESVMFPLGRPRPEVLAYRIEFGLTAIDPEAGGETFVWSSTTFVPARLRAKEHGATPHGRA